VTERSKSPKPGRKEAAPKKKDDAQPSRGRNTRSESPGNEVHSCYSCSTDDFQGSKRSSGKGSLPRKDSREPSPNPTTSDLKHEIKTLKSRLEEAEAEVKKVKKEMKEASVKYETLKSLHTEQTSKAKSDHRAALEGKMNTIKELRKAVEESDKEIIEVEVDGLGMSRNLANSFDLR
jgi:chromosome segregation ATPase